MPDEPQPQIPVETRTLTRPTASTAASAPEAGSAPGSVPVSASASGDSPAPGAALRYTRLLVIGIVLAALNLRPAITSLGALLEEVRDGLHMSGSVAGVLTSVPPLCFAVFGFTAPRLARRYGAGAIVCAGMVAITAGLLIRPFAGGTPAFLAASAFALMGIAVSNVLMPVIVKRYFPDRVGTMTGLYSMALAFGTAVAAAATVPMTEALGGSWRTGLGIWAVLAAVAVLPWLGLVRDRGAAPLSDREPSGREPSGREPSGRGLSGRQLSGGAPAAHGPATGQAPGLRLGRSRTAWALACFFGLQATGAYITMGWMPQVFRDAGVPAGTAGLLLAVTMVMGVPLAFVIPGLAARMRNQGPIVVGLGVCGLTAFSGLYFAPAGGAWLWAVLLGISNCSFPLALTMIGMRSRSGAGVVRLSAFAQSTGYLISIPGPLLVGVLYQHTGGWGLPIALMAGFLVPQMVAGVIAGQDRTIEDEARMRD
ncbi:CynX/NimT family MFS transporter [Streptomyces sp. NPDC056672]|uniref:CynX/NimT family MFS transporter n=1 Tax=Streptomyces sp. NPDC056672 TaxID=3345906 RepID=UPI00368AF09B